MIDGNPALRELRALLALERGGGTLVLDPRGSTRAAGTATSDTVGTDEQE